MKASLNTPSMFQNMLLSAITPDPDQPRKQFDPAALDELAQSMAENGLAVPVLVRPHGDGYMLVHGERRYRAALSLGWETLPAEVRTLTEKQARRLALIENIQRADLSPIDEARAYDSLLATGLNQAQLGKQIGKGQSYIAQKLRLLKMPAHLVILVERDAITENHARQLLKVKGWYHGAEEEINGEGSTSVEPWVEMAILRPLDAEWVTPIKSAHREAIKRAIEQYLADNCPAVRSPSWTRIALWYGCMTAEMGWTVVELSQILDRHIRQVYSAVAMTGHPYSKEPASLVRMLLEADCRHAGVSEPPPKLKLAALNRVLSDGWWISPSACQKGGHHEGMIARGKNLSLAVALEVQS